MSYEPRSGVCRAETPEVGSRGCHLSLSYILHIFIPSKEALLSTIATSNRNTCVKLLAELPCAGNNRETDDILTKLKNMSSSSSLLYLANDCI